MPRLYVDLPLQAATSLTLPPNVARHAQVLRLQPGAVVTLFDGRGGEWSAEVLRMGRHDVDVQIGMHVDIARELAVPVTIAVGMPANDRMDDLVEKATELGVAAIQPLVCMRSVLRLAGERAVKKQQHWQAVAIAACEQSGRTRVPTIAPVRTFGDWLGQLQQAGHRAVLSLHGDAVKLTSSTIVDAGDGWIFLSGPEGGLSPEEEALACAKGFTPTTLANRVLRADTAPLAALAIIGAFAG